MHTSGPAPFSEAEHQGRFFSISLFTGAPLRGAVNDGRADFMPIFLSDIPCLFTKRIVPLDIAFLQLSPPDRHGYCTLGTSVDTALAASQSARYVIAEINEQMPRTHGNTTVRVAGPRLHPYESSALHRRSGAPNSHR
jgi:acyl-CoA hydrolase